MISSKPRSMRSSLQAHSTRRDRHLIKHFCLPSCEYTLLSLQHVNRSSNLSIRHRASKIDQELRLQKLRGFINPVQHLWQNTELNEAIMSFNGFCDLMGLNKVRDYLVTCQVHDIQEWGLYQLDTEGQSLQKELEEKLKVRIPSHP